MTTPCVVLCSEVRSNLSAAELTPLLDRLDLLFEKNVSPLDGNYIVRSLNARGVDGGNGGGGEAAKPPPIFIAGTHGVGMWNFRYCRPYPSAQARANFDRDISFPSAARIEVCAYFSSVGTAKQALDSGAHAVLHEIFENVLIVPLSKPKGAGDGYTVQQVDVSVKGAM